MVIKQIIEVPRDLNFLTLIKLLQSVGEDLPEQMKLPHEISDRGGLGLEGELIQLIASWMRIGDCREIISSCHGQNVELTNSLYGIFAVRIAESIKDMAGNICDKKLLLGSAYDLYKSLLKQDFSRAAKNGYLPIPCISARNSSKEFNSPLYSGDKLIDRPQFNSLFTEAISAVLGENVYHQSILSQVTGLSGIVFELFENTHKHGRYDLSGRLIEENCRAIIINYRSIDMEFLIRQQSVSTVDPDFFRFYYPASVWISEKGLNLPVLDITVVDCGVGFASNFSKKDVRNMSATEEINLVSECFNKYRTSSDNLASGMGLNNVLLSLRKIRGKMRLRTGRITLSKAFYDEADGENFTEKNFASHEGKPIVGSSISISMPLWGDDNV